MKNIYFIILISMGLLILNSGCSSTWSGIKKDTKNSWNYSKEKIHKATE